MNDAQLPIDLAHLDDAAFERLYKQRIEPCFSSNEAVRVEAVASFKRRMTIGVVAGLVAGALAFLWLRDVAPTLLIAGGVIGVGAIIAYQALAQFARTLKREYCTHIAEAMGASFVLSSFEPPALNRFRQLRLLPNYDRSHFEDLFSGAHKGARYELYEARLQQRRTDSKGRTRYTTVFRGQLIRMQFPRDFLGVTIVRRDAGVFNVFGGGEVDGRRLERVGLVSEFEKVFEVWSSDQVEARYLLHPVMMARLIDLEKGLHAKRLRCAFENGELLVAVEGGNLFEPGDLFKPLVDPTRARRIVNEIAGVVRVMDEVLTAQTLRPPS